MNPAPGPRHPFKAIVAIVAMAAVVHGVCAHARTHRAEATDVDVAAPLPLHAACPAVDTADLADDLAPAWDGARVPSTVAVRFLVRGRHVYDVEPDTPSPRTWHQIRRVVYGLSCDAGDDQAHSVRLVVRFVDGHDDARVARIDVADDPEDPEDPDDR